MCLYEAWVGNLYSGGVDGIKVWAWSEITSSTSCQPKASLVTKEICRQDYEVNSMAVNNVRRDHMVAMVTAAFAM